MREIKSYSRKVGRGFRQNKKLIFSQIYPQYKINSEKTYSTINDFLLNHKLQNYNEIALEIGFGMGESFIERAKSSPDKLFLGCEVFINGIANVLEAIKEYKLNNIRLLNDDALIILKNLPDNCLSEIYLLFPDPWPKIKHHKRRIVNESFLNLINAKLKDNGLFLAATDHFEYSLWILGKTLEHSGFQLKLDNELGLFNFPVNWFKSKYHVKSENLGLKPFLMIFSNIK